MTSCSLDWFGSTGLVCQVGFFSEAGWPKKVLLDKTNMESSLHYVPDLIVKI